MSHNILFLRIINLLLSYYLVFIIFIFYFIYLDLTKKSNIIALTYITYSI